MKKLLCLLLSAIMLTSLVACGNNGGSAIDDVEKAENDRIEEQEGGSDELPTNVRSQGNLPDSYSEFTQEEKSYYNRLIIEAVQSFDYETIAKYTNEFSSDAVDCLKIIQENDEYRDLYDSIVGSAFYFEKTEAIAGRRIGYMFNKWFNEMEQSGKTLPETTGLVPSEDAKAIYERYFAETPWVIMPFNSVGQLCEIVDGNLYYNIDEIFCTIGYPEITAMIPPENQFYGDGYSRLILGDEDHLSLGYDYILQEDMCPYYATILSKDLNELVELIDSSDVDYSDCPSYCNYYEKIFKNETHRKQIQSWIDDNVIILKGFGECVVYIPAPIDVIYYWLDLSDDEVALFADKPLVVAMTVCDLANDFNNFAAYCEIINIMDRQGIIDAYAMINE